MNGVFSNPLVRTGALCRMTEARGVPHGAQPNG